MLGMSSETRKHTRSHLKFPKVDATVQSADNKLARLKTFTLDALVPLTAILEGANEMTRNKGDINHSINADWKC